MDREKFNQRKSELRKKAEELIEAGEYPQKWKMKSPFKEKEFIEILSELDIHSAELDIANRHLRESNSELSRLKNRYHDLYQNAPVAYISLNLDYSIVEANYAAAQMLSANRNSLIGRNLYSFLTSEGRNIFSTYIGRLKQTKEDIQSEITLYNLLEKPVQVILEVSESEFESEAGGEGSYPLLLCTLTDISNIKRLYKEREHLLQEAQQHWKDAQNLASISAINNRALQTLFENIPEAIILFNPDGDIININTAAKRCYGFSDNVLFDDAEQNPSISDIKEKIKVYSTEGEPIPFTRWPHYLAIRGKKFSNNLYKINIKDDAKEWTGSFNSAPIYNEEDELKKIILIHSDLTERISLEQELAEAKGHLEEIVVERTQELLKANQELQQEVELRKELERQLRNHQNKLRSMSSKLSRSNEDLRNESAIAIHDKISQTLAGVNMRLTAISSQIDQKELKKEIEEAREILKTSLHETRNLITVLHPPVLENADFISAIQWIADNMRDNFGIEVKIVDKRRNKKLEKERKTLLFRTLEELMENIVRFAEASKVEIDINDQAGVIALSVVDNGRGFDPAEIESGGGLGLFSIREKVEMFSGAMEISSSLGKGSRISIRVPLPSYTTASE